MATSLDDIYVHFFNNDIANINRCFHKEQTAHTQINVAILLSLYYEVARI